MCKRHQKHNLNVGFLEILRGTAGAYTEFKKN